MKSMWGRTVSVSFAEPERARLHFETDRALSDDSSTDSGTLGQRGEKYRVYRSFLPAVAEAALSALR